MDHFAMMTPYIIHSTGVKPSEILYVAFYSKCYNFQGRFVKDLWNSVHHRWSNWTTLRITGLKLFANLTDMSTAPVPAMSLQ